MTGHAPKVTIWFFIGSLLLVYGVLILAAQALSTPAQPVVLAEYRFGYWMGGFLIALGGYYCIHFWPGRRSG
jgi:hypothetical protein